MTNQRYHISIIILHWLMALIIISLIAVGFYMANLEKEVTYGPLLFFMHKSFGASILLLVFARIIIRAIKKAPELPKTMSKLIVRFSHLVHYILYLLMIIMPLSGYLMSNYYGRPVKLFFINLPNLVDKNIEMGKFFGKTHEILAFIFIATITIHIMGAIKHRFFDKKEHDIIQRMI